VLVSDLIFQTREVLQDMAGDRYTDDRIIRALNLGVLDLRRVRPDVFIGRYHEPTFQATLPGEVFPLPSEIVPSLIKYMAGWVELADDEYTNDGRAAALLGAFGTDLGARR
jgi:hypothetical protein